MEIKVQIKSAPPFNVIIVTNLFKHQAMPKIDSYHCLRSRLIDHQYGDVLLALMCFFFSGGDRTEHFNVLISKLLQRIDFRLCNLENVLRYHSKLAMDDIGHTSPIGKKYRFYTTEPLNSHPINDYHVTSTS